MNAAGGGGSVGWSASGNTATNASRNFIGTTDSTGMAFRTDDTSRLTILGGGAVGVRTSVLPQPDARLAINGVVYAKKVMATQTGWPDYVFDTSYSLPSLISVGLFIRMHRHLPGMPSATEAAVNGVDLGENQAELLKKIEELTLYLIDVQKKTAERQQEIDRLEKTGDRIDRQQAELAKLKQELVRLIPQKKLLH
jgi:hypothetical protein